jgi:hypothetical protein
MDSLSPVAAALDNFRPILSPFCSAQSLFLCLEASHDRTW